MALPDDKPITSICVVEDSKKCPPGFQAILKTYDQDSDADLWRESNFFSKRITRYLCYSKSEVIANYLVQNICIINDKEVTPVGFSIITKTEDGDSKALRKRQICYSLTSITKASYAVSDIIILGKGRKVPDKFSSAGEINGMLLCFKISQIKPTFNGNISLLNYSLSPNGYSEMGNDNSVLSSSMTSLNVSDGGSKPKRPAPQVPQSPVSLPYPTYNICPVAMPRNKNSEHPVKPFENNSYGTLVVHQGLEEIPFVPNSKLNLSHKVISSSLPKIKAKTRSEIDRTFHYNFRLEKQTVNN